jgi:hypothetical protein
LSNNKSVSGNGYYISIDWGVVKAKSTTEGVKYAFEIQYMVFAAK